MKIIESRSMKCDGKNLFLLDQRKLPDLEDWVKIETLSDMYDAIYELKVRGAPAIGVAASLFVALALENDLGEKDFIDYCEKLKSSRPTAVNLMVCLDRLMSYKAYDPLLIIKQAEQIFDEDVELCEKMSSFGAELINDGDGIITHCNTGGLATAGIGTALGVIEKAHTMGKKIHVYVDETRPLLQGGRLTAWELEKLEIPYTLICDNMAASVIRSGEVQSAFVGADRIAANGDFANKIGTYSLAINCDYHKIPFYTVAPYTTLDLDCKDGGDIPIELRRASEVRGVSGFFGDFRWAPKNSETFNPAFDVTPAQLVTGWVLDSGVYNKSNLSQWCNLI